jgi:hypothetical protein
VGMAFEIFTGKNSRATGYALTIDKRGLFSISGEAYAALSEPTAVQLLFDRENQVLALWPIEAGAENSYGVRTYSRGAAAHVTGTAFLRHYGIDFPTGPALRRTAEIRDGMLQVDLRQEPVKVTSNRAKAA